MSLFLISGDTLTSDGIQAIAETLERPLLPGKPLDPNRSQAWYDRMAERQRTGWSAERERLLRAAQRAEDMRDKAIGRLVG